MSIIIQMEEAPSCRLVFEAEQCRAIAEEVPCVREAVELDHVRVEKRAENLLKTAAMSEIDSETQIEGSSSGSKEQIHREIRESTHSEDEIREITHSEDAPSDSRKYTPGKRTF